MSNNINSISQLQNMAENKGKTDEKPTFMATGLTVTVTRDDTGKVVGTYPLEARGFKSGNKDGTCGIGWYDSPGQGNKRDDGGEFDGHPLSCAFRLSLKGLKVKPDAVIDLTAADDDSDAE